MTGGARRPRGAAVPHSRLGQQRLPRALRISDSSKPNAPGHSPELARSGQGLRAPVRSKDMGSHVHALCFARPSCSRTACAWLAAPTAFLAVASAIAGCDASQATVAEALEQLSDDAIEIGASPGVVPDELIVEVRPGAAAEALDELYTNVGASVTDRLDALATELLQINPEDREEIRDELEASPLIEGVVDNQILESPTPVEETPVEPTPWHLLATQVEAAWEITRGDPAIAVAVLDTGVDSDHTALVGQLVGGGSTVAQEPGWEDAHGHGTAVAGIVVAAPFRAAGVDAVAPNARVIPIRVADAQGRATSWALTAGMNLALSEGARIINVSIAPLHHDQLVMRQAEAARVRGALVVFASGNEGELVDGGGSAAALFVGAIDQQGARQASSSYGAFLSLVAPGVGIHSTRVGGGYTGWSGTSFAAPIVAGVANLVWSVNPRFRPATVQGVILSTATDIGPAGVDVEHGAGRVNALAAVQLAAALVEQQDTTAPAVAFTKPSPASRLTGVTTVELSVIDEGDVVDVTLLLDGVALATDFAQPYSFALDTRLFGEGAHDLSARAVDFSGNTGNATLQVLFPSLRDSAPPSLTIISPSPGAAVSGVVTILATASDDVALERVEVSLDGKRIDTIWPTGKEAQIAYNWNTNQGVAPGAHSILLHVFDTAGNSTKAALEVTKVKD